MSKTPDWALPLCPNCGAWGQGTPVEIVDLQCRIAAAYVIARGAKQSDVWEKTNARCVAMGNAPLSPNFPEPIDWKLAATLDYPIEGQKGWVTRQAKEQGAS